MNIDFYRAFEERYRGSRDAIKERFRAYLPFVEALRIPHRDLQAVDLGCGRGEWLELLRDHGLAALGIDLDEHMLAACRERELWTETADAVDWLVDRADASCDLITAFHVAEHLPFDRLDLLVRHGLRVLRPGGLLILETPNPENIIVATADFYLDPTHQRPLPPALLSFLTEYHGFLRTKIVRLQESPELASGREPTLFDVLGGASPDYAVIAQSKDNAVQLAVFDALFAQEYGIKTDTLALRYQQGTQHALHKALALAGQSAEKVDAALALAGQSAEKVDAALALAGQSAEKMDAFAAWQQQHVSRIEQQLQALYTSRSWRVTAPLRWTTTVLRSGFAVLMRVARKGGRPLLVLALDLVERSAFVKKNVLGMLRYLPRLEAHLRCFAARRRVATVFPQASVADMDHETMPLTPDAWKVYAELKRAIEESKSKDIS